jgi:hypothetical protein
MTSVEFTGLDGQKYLIPKLHDFSEQSDIKLPKIKNNASDVDIIGHVMLIVASQPSYIGKADTPWLLAHLLELRNFAASLDRGNLTYFHVNALERFDDLVSVVRSIFALELVMCHANGFYLTGAHTLHNVFENTDDYRKRISVIGKRDKSSLTADYFNGAIYNCRVPEGISVTLSTTNGKTFQAGDEFLLIQERFHGSENFYARPPNVSMQGKAEGNYILDEFSVQGRILQALTDETPYRGDYCTQNIAEIPCSWLQASGRSIERLKSAVALDSPDCPEVIDLAKEPSFSSSIQLSLYDRHIEAAKVFLFGNQRLGMTEELFSHLCEKHDVIDLEIEARKLLLMIEQNLKISIPKKKAFVSKHPVLFNIFNECDRSITWLLFRGKISQDIFNSLALSQHNLNKDEATEFYAKCEYLYPYPFKLIPVEYQGKSDIFELLPSLCEEDFQFIDWKSITEVDLKNHYGEDAYHLQWTPAAKILRHLLPADIDLEMPDDFRRRLIRG